MRKEGAMVFVKVMCAHKYFTKEKSDLFGELLRMLVAQKLNIGVEPIQVRFSTEQVAQGPSEHVLIEVLIFWKRDPLLRLNEFARDLLIPVEGYFNRAGMSTAKIACSVEDNDGRGFAVSRM